MTEVVTNAAAALQQTLVAEHQQRALSVSASHSDTNSSNAATSVSSTGISGANAVARPPKSDQAQADSGDNKQPAPEQKIKRTAPDPAETPRASRSESNTEALKIEIKDFDVGRRAAEVVGTPDVVQRFDNNLDGRIDQLESQRAARGRDTSFTYAARGQARTDAPSIAEQVQDREIAQSIVAPVQNSAPAPASQAGHSAETGQPAQKVFVDAQVVSGGTDEDGTVPKKLFGSEAVASQGTFSDGAPVDQKLYGDGAEVVIGRFAADQDGQQKLYDKVVQAETGRFYKDGSGEQKLYDKVAQSEPGRFYDGEAERKLYDEAEQTQTGHTGEEQGAELSLYEKAQQLKAQAGTDVANDQQPKKLYTELELYADVAEFSNGTVEVPVAGVGAVTV